MTTYDFITQTQCIHECTWDEAYLLFENIFVSHPYLVVGIDTGKQFKRSYELKYRKEHLVYEEN